MKNVKHITLLPFATMFFPLCAGSMFPSSSYFVNERITPKYYRTVFCLPVMLLTCIIFSLFTKEKTVITEKLAQAICTIISAVCLLQTAIVGFE